MPHNLLRELVTAMQDLIHVLIDGEEFGPYSDEEFRQYFHEQKIINRARPVAAAKVISECILPSRNAAFAYRPAEPYPAFFFFIVSSNFQPGRMSAPEVLPACGVVASDAPCGNATPLAIAYLATAVFSSALSPACGLQSCSRSGAN